MKPLILYYSYSGNTRKIAEMMCGMLTADLAEIETILPYIGSYNAVVNQGQKEVSQKYEPEIKPLSVDLNAYDTIILGTPVWWYTFAPALRTVLSNFSWKGKKIYPFATNGGGVGHTFQEIEKMCKGAQVEKGLDIYFSGSMLRTNEKEIEKWIQAIR